MKDTSGVFIALNQGLIFQQHRYNCQSSNGNDGHAREYNSNPSLFRDYAYDKGNQSYNSNQDCNGGNGVQPGEHNRFTKPVGSEQEDICEKCNQVVLYRFFHFLFPFFAVGRFLPL